MNINIPDAALLKFRKALKAGEKRWAKWLSEALKTKQRELDEKQGKRQPPQ